MSATTITPRTIDAAPPAPRSTGAEVTAARVVNAEWIKLRTLRSSWLTLLAAVVALIGVGLVIAYATGTANWAALEAEDTAASAPLQGYQLTALLIGALGVLYVTGEYATGMIRSTFAAVPRRRRVLGAKSLVFGIVTLVVMTLASFVTFFAAQVILGANGHASSLSDPGALRAVAGVGAYLALVGLMGGALGWIIRSTAGAISALIGLLIILPAIVALLPGSLSETLSKYLPSNAGGSFLSSSPIPGALAPWAGIGVFAIWVAVALGAAAVVINRRDA